ncbi:Nn.00g112100.m01.CDS01 [Neocucurbitaria sp. VM-36]
MPPSSKVRSLFHVLQGNSSLRAPIKCIFLYVPDHEIEGQKVANFRILKNILQGLTNLRCLNIHGGFKAKVSNEQMFTILRNMPCASPHVEHLVLNREAWGLYLKDITNNIQFPRLRSLQVHGISKYKGDLTLDPKKLHTASFTSLTLSDYEESPQATALLLSWPKNLEHFNFGSFYNNRYTMDYAMFTWWLSIHCETLKSVAIGYLSWHSSFRVFDATRFPNLEILKLSPHAMAVDLEFRDSARKILGPKVRTFGWDFSMNDQHSEGWTAFGEREDLWIRELAKAAKAQKAALVEIEITFTPDHWTLKREWGYPWDRMIRVRDDIAALNGISLSWNKPTLTREGWLEELERQEEPEQHLTIDEHLIESIPMAVEREPESSTESSGEEDFDAFEPFQPNCDIRDYFRHVERTQ